MLVTLSTYNDISVYSFKLSIIKNSIKIHLLIPAYLMFKQPAEFQ